MALKIYMGIWFLFTIFGMLTRLGSKAERNERIIALCGNLNKTFEKSRVNLYEAAMLAHTFLVILCAGGYYLAFTVCSEWRVMPMAVTGILVVAGYFMQFKQITRNKNFLTAGDRELYKESSKHEDFLQMCLLLNEFLIPVLFMRGRL